MTYFKFTVLNQIKSAVDEKDVERVDARSIKRLMSSNVNGHLIQRFMVDMDKTQDEAKLEETSERVLQNVDTAIRFFRELHRARSIWHQLSSINFLITPERT
jgi:hypothetical protein